MSKTTYLELFKHDDPVNNTDQFDVEKSLNGNWDKIDIAVGQANTKIATIEKDNTTNKTNISTIKAEQTTQNTELDRLKAENERLRNDLSGLPTGTLSGETIDITDSAEMRFSEFNVRGNSKQDGEPTPDTPVDVESCGDNVNLFEQCNGIWYDTNSYKYIDNATVYGFMAKVKPNTTYTISKKNQGNRFIITAGSQPVKTGNSLTRIVFASNHTITNYTFTTQENESYVFLGVHNGTNASEIALAVEETKIVEGTNTGAYSPYGQGCINEVVCNKNLAKLEVTGQYRNYANGTLSGNGDFSSFIAKVKPDTNYVVSNGHSNLCYFDKNMNFLKGEVFTGKTTFNTNNMEDVCYATLAVQSEKTNIFMIEEGSIATEIVEHQSQTHTIPTQQPMRAIGDIRDTFVKVDGKWYERHNVNRIVFDGTENWEAIGTNTSGKYRFQTKISPNEIISNSDANTYLQGFCNMFVVGTPNTTYLCQTGIATLMGYIIIYNENVSDTVDNFKAWLQVKYNAGTPVYVDYILATPIDIECTTEQSAILDNLENTVKSYKGVTHIYSTDEVAPNVEVTYKKDLNTMINNLNTALVALGGI